MKIVGLGSSTGGLAPTRECSTQRFLKSLTVDSGKQAVAQDRSAQVDEMPEPAIATGSVDHVLDPRQL